MASAQVADALKQLTLCVTSQKTKHRIHVLREVVRPVVAKPDFPENGCKFLSYLLLLTLERYRDVASQRAVESVIYELATHHGQIAVRLLGAGLLEVSQGLRSTRPSCASGSVAYSGFRWSCLLVTPALAGMDAAESSQEFKDLLQAHCFLYSAVMASPRRSVRTAACRCIQRTLSSVSMEPFFAAMLAAEPDKDSLCLLNEVISFCVQHKKAWTDSKAAMLEHFQKAVLAGRSRVSDHVLISCVPLLRHVTHDDFSTVLLPAVERGLLRSPELLVPCLGRILSSLSLDLSQYVMSIGKPIATQLHSQDVARRQDAVKAVSSLAKQCSDPSAVEQFVKHLFAVLNGSEGKLTVAEQRVDVLDGIGAMAAHTVSGAQSLQSLHSSVVQLFLPVLTQEVNESTLVHVLGVLSQWTLRLPTTVPDTLTAAFKKNIVLKTCTSPVRAAYYRCMNSAFQGNTLVQGMDVLPLLLQAIERGVAQPHQIMVVSEAVSASCLIAQLSLTQVEAESKVAPFWTAALDVNKQLMTSEKFFSQATAENLQQWLVLAERLLVDHTQRFNTDTCRPWQRGLVRLLTHTCWSLRCHAQTIVKKLLVSGSGLSGDSSALRDCFSSFLAPQTVPSDNEEVEGAGASVSGGQRHSVAPFLLVSAFRTVTLAPHDLPADAAHKLVIDCLLDAHHPAIVCHSRHEWMRLLLSVRVDLASLITAHGEKILQHIVTSMSDKSLQPAALNAVSTLAVLSPEFLDSVVRFSVDVLGLPALAHVTSTEVGIARTEDGQLYNTSLVDSVRANESSKVQNMKRESKAYSFEEQKLEAELREELKLKKVATEATTSAAASKGKQSKGKAGAGGKGGKKGGVAAVGDMTLSKKQQEIVESTLKQEAETRKRVLELEQRLLSATSLLEACILANSEAMRPHMTQVLPAVLVLVPCPLPAPSACQLWLSLRKCVMTDEQKWLGELVGHATLRLLRPACPLETGWEAEPLQSQVTRAVRDLLTVTGAPSTLQKSSSVVGQPLPASTFSYCLLLLRRILLGCDVLAHDQDLKESALGVVYLHCHLRPSSAFDIDEDGPKQLPRQQMFSLLIDVIAQSTDVKLVKLQGVACDSLVALCHLSSGKPSCATISGEELSVLLDASESSCDELRRAVLNGLLELLPVLPIKATTDGPADYGDVDQSVVLARRVWLLRFDAVEVNKRLAEKLWDDGGFMLAKSQCVALLGNVVHKEEKVRTAGALALGAAVEQHPKEITSTMKKLFDLYAEKRDVPLPEFDSVGRQISKVAEDPWPARCGIAMAISHLAKFLTQTDIDPVVSFFVPEALNDPSAEVRKKMLSAAVATVEEHGKANVVMLLSVFEDCLEMPDAQSSDSLRQSVVVLMGSLARHLDKDDPKVRPIVQRLISTLDTPSQSVQEAVANCLPPLVPAIKSESAELVANLLNKLLEGTQFAERKGAAYGLAGLVKGLGIASLKQLNVMATLTEAIQNKKNYRHREGALFSLEMLCLMLGRLFEPYIIHILPHLLLCFGDGNNYVRDAADDTARAVMQKLSAHGVKLVLPSLLQAIEDDSWRTKIGSVELLGAMAYCAPKQLSSCLPSIVPKLTAVMTDSHIKVQKAGSQALQQIGSVIKNPEIQAISQVLLQALADPDEHTSDGLRALLQTAFVHMIDAPSLALVMPILERALQQRGSDVKKMSCQIMASMYSLTDHKDLSPYLPAVMPGVKAALLDPLPEVRTVSAKALGAMVKGHGEESLHELVPWLLEVLVTDNSVDRSGSAQGLSEVLAAQGLDKLKEMMPEFIASAQRMDQSAISRDGYLMLFVYLPVTFGEAFVPFIATVIPPILKGLADESEFVRETSLRAGQRIISMYAETAIAIFLPELEHGLFDENWRIRHSSMQLLGDLLYRLSGVTGKMSAEGDEDEGFGTESSHKAILEALGLERRNRVLAGIYMGRSDVALLVRQASLHVWKVVVANTPRTLRDILPTLFTLLLGCLASTSYDKRQVAARTLGDLVRKLGERVLPEIIPILENGLDSEESDERQGVCIGLSEIIASTSRDMVMQFVDSLVPTVRRALCDELPNVRKAAALTFDRLHSTIGPRAMQEILPPLLEMLKEEGPSAAAALDGLQQVMAIKSRELLPFLVPKLTARPVNSRALAQLGSVAGEALNRHLSRILQALVEAVEEAVGTDREDEELSNSRLLVLSVGDDIGVQSIIEELLTFFKHQHPGRRRAAADLLFTFCSQSGVDYLQHVPALLRGLLRLLNDPDQSVLLVAWEALNAVTKTLTPPDQLSHISHLRQAVRFVTDDVSGGLLPGFCIPKKGLTPVLPMLREGILNGPPELKEQAACGLGEVISLTSAEALKASVVPITGPLIRILGDRFGWNVKVALLETLRILIIKVGVVLKPFLPQLQTTFIKALHDSNRAVRLRASAALQRLVVLHTRVDPLFTELHNGVKNTEDSAVRETILQALRGVLLGAGKKMGEAIRKSLSATLVGLLGTSEDSIRHVAGACVGALCCVVPTEQTASLMQEHVLVDDAMAEWTVRHGRVLALCEAAAEGSATLKGAGLWDDVMACAVRHAQADRLPVCMAGLRALGHLWAHVVRTSEDLPSTAVSSLNHALAHSSGEVRVEAARSIRVAARAGSLPQDVIIAVLPPLLSNAREKASPARIASEQALVAILQLRNGTALLEDITGHLDSSTAHQLSDTHRRSLARIAQSSEDDEEDAFGAELTS